MKKSTLALILTLIVVTLLLSLYITRCNKEEYGKEQNLSLLSALNDSIRYYKNKDSDNVATISVLETYATKDFLALQTKDQEILDLQSVVKEYKGNLKPGSSVTVTSTETRIKHVNPTTVTVPRYPDTSNRWYIDDTGKYVILRKNYVGKEPIWPVYEDSVKNEWIDYYARMDKDSAILDLKIFNKFSVVIGKDKKRTFADVTTDNPYTEVKTLRTYQVAQPVSKPKRFGIGLSTGITYIDKWRPYIGAGFNYNLIRF